MSDRLTIEQRHNNMAAIRGRDTKPEILVEFHSQHIYLPVYLIYLSAITSIPSLSISLSRMGLRCWCFRIISTGQPRRASRYAFRRTIRKNLGAFLHRYLHRCHHGAGFLPSLVFILNILFKKAFALTGRKADCAYTQGVTLG